MELNDFYNDGYGWVCRHCRHELEKEGNGMDRRSRFMREGEAESKLIDLSNKALAKWADPAHTTLICPRCGITERVEKS